LFPPLESSRLLGEDESLFWRWGFESECFRIVAFSAGVIRIRGDLDRVYPPAPAEPRRRKHPRCGHHGCSPYCRQQCHRHGGKSRGGSRGRSRPGHRGPSRLPILGTDRPGDPTGPGPGGARGRVRWRVEFALWLWVYARPVGVRALPGYGFHRFHLGRPGARRVSHLARPSAVAPPGRHRPDEPTSLPPCAPVSANRGSGSSSLGTDHGLLPAGRNYRGTKPVPNLRVSAFGGSPAGQGTRGAGIRAGVL
jgi:hypothetical protein